MRMDGLEQVVLTVADVQATARFYVQGLGLLASRFDAVATTLHCGGQKLVLQPASDGQRTSGPLGLCFHTQLPIAIVTGHLAVRGIPLMAGPRRGRDGRESVVVQDPDGHAVEIVSTAPAP